MFAKRKLGIILLVLVIGILTILMITKKDSIAWRWDAFQAYARGVVNPVEALPAPLVTTVILNTPTPSATFTPEPDQATPTLPASPTALPQQVTLDSPTWERQDWNNCGPATLAMYLRFYGWTGDQFDVSGVVKPDRTDRNVNVEELLYYAWNNAGWLHATFRVGGDIDLLRTLIANGIPVMVEESLYFEENYWPDDDKWAGHYLLLTGFDDAQQAFVSQDSFRGGDRMVGYQELDQNWEPFNRVYILVYHPNQEGLVQQILGEDWDIQQNRQHALEIAQAEVAADPDNVFAWFNLGSNYVYFEDYDQAAQAYDQARILGLPQRMLRYQFGPFLAYFHSGRNEDLAAIVEYALQITPNAEEAWLWQGWLFYRQGDSVGAVVAFREAYWANPTYVDAQYALDFMGASP